MSETPHYANQPLKHGEMEILADGGVRWAGWYSGNIFSLSAEELRGKGYQAAEEYAHDSQALNGYKLVRTTIGPFGSGATLTTSGDKIVGRVEPDHEQCIGNRLMTAEELHTALKAVVDACRAQDAPTEALRDPLTWNTETPFDTFKGFDVVSIGIDYASGVVTPAFADRPAPKGSTLHAHPGKDAALLRG